MAKVMTEYDVEARFIERLESIGYEYVELKDYRDVLANFRIQLAAFNRKKLIDAKGEAAFSDAEFNRVLIHLDNHTVYESAKLLRDKYVLTLDNGKTVYLDFFSFDTDRNIYQVSHQITMNPAHKDDVVYKNRYDVTVIINGLPLVQIELKRPGIEINEAINQINRYRKFSFKGLFRYLQLFVVSNSVQTKYFCNENEMEDGMYNPILKSLVFFWTDAKNKRINTLEEFTSEFFRKAAITEMIDKYMVIKSTEPVLMVMRPYQIYAVKAARKRILEANQNGYVFACTGSGKTLTSFKLAQLLRNEPRINKVIFLIDRKDLDDQTVDEYNSFEKDCVDSSDSTYVLVKQLQDSDRKLIVTTIQKMANAIKSQRYEKLMDTYQDKKVVFIIDECHRSQFGKMHGDIERHFRKANYIGFTGTPIFEANKGADGRTTADVFNAGLMPDGNKRDACLHRYMIKDAIADGNVLRFSVEYQRTIFAHHIAMRGINPDMLDDPEYCKRHNIDMDDLYHDDERIKKVAKHIFEHHEQHNNAIANPESRKLNRMSVYERLEATQEAGEAYKRIKSKDYPVNGNKCPQKANELAEEGKVLFQKDAKTVKDFYGFDIRSGTEASEFKCDFPIITCSADNILREILVDKGQKYTDGSTDLFIFVLDAEFESVEYFLSSSKYNGCAIAFLSAILESPFPVVYLCVWDFYNQAYFIRDAKLLTFWKENGGLKWKKE